MISLDYDFSGLWKLLVMFAAGAFAVWSHEVTTILMWFVAAWYCWQAHDNYVRGAKPYARLGGHLKRAVDS